jgi:hypothetical protein
MQDDILDIAPLIRVGDACITDDPEKRTTASFLVHLTKLVPEGPSI